MKTVAGCRLPVARKAHAPGGGRLGGALRLARLSLVLVVMLVIGCRRGSHAVVASKVFTESVVLGDVAAGLARSHGADVTHRRQLGGTQILWKALVRGDIDAYPEYTGTIAQEIFAGRRLDGPDAIRSALAEQGVEMTRPLGFNDTYALGMRRDVAEKLGIRTISDLRRHPTLRLGFSNEFLDRADGWASLKAAYALPQAGVTGLDHDLAYRALAGGSIDVTDLYSTDAEIAQYGFAVLEDDLHHFPEYQAVYLYRRDLGRRAPEVAGALNALAGRINRDAMISMNAAVKVHKETETHVAAEFLSRSFGVADSVAADGLAGRIGRRTLEHLGLVLPSLLAAILVAIPLGIAAAQFPRAGEIILGGVAAIYTIPALALLVFMLPLLGIGWTPAVVALWLYSLLPIVRNTQAGLRGIGSRVIDSARVLGLPGHARLLRIELPLAAPSILAGVQTAAVLNVGTATLGALIGAGGYGQPILTGIRLDAYGRILEGAVPAALMALAVQGVFELASRYLLPRGLRR